MKIIEHSHRVITGYFYRFFTRSCFPKALFQVKVLYSHAANSLFFNFDANSLATRLPRS